MTFSNYHTHTYLCDGKDSPEELVEYAISLGCPAIGFSGHGYTEFDTSYCMSIDTEKEYKEIILALKEKYKDRIKILLGIEQDFYSTRDYSDYDYIIGGVHYIEQNGKFYDVDAGREHQLKTISEAFGGDAYAYAEAYYKNVAELYSRTKCDIVAHFDLLCKFNEASDIFDTSHNRYTKAADTALASLSKHKVMFEVNTGAISRGYRTSPYPEPRILDKIKEHGNGILLSSDCHAKENLLFGFEAFKHLLY